MRKRNWTGRRSTKERFVGLPHYLVMGKDSAGQAFRALSSNARSALIQIVGRYNGVNNGFINASCRALALEMNVPQRPQRARFVSWSNVASWKSPNGALRFEGQERERLPPHVVLLR